MRKRSLGARDQGAGSRSLAKRRNAVVAAVTCVVLLASAAAFADLATTEQAGPQGDGTSITPFGWKITPAGSQDALGERPYGMALSPDGTELLISNAGVGEQSVMLIDAASGEVTDEISYPAPEAVFLGVAFAPDGAHAYVSAGANDKVRVYSVEDGGLKEQKSLELKSPAFPAGLAVSSDGSTLYAAGHFSNALSIVDLATGKERSVRLKKTPCPAAELGFDPSNGTRCNFSYGVTLSQDGSKAFVSNWGKKTVSVVDTEKEKLVGAVRVGTHPNAMALSPSGDELYVANADSDTISVIDPEAGSVARSFSVRPYPGAPVGSNPNALAVSPNGETLYVANAGDNDIAVVDLALDGGEDEVVGTIPTGWYPTGVAVTGDGSELYVANAKGLGAGPNPNGPNPTENPESSPDQYIGSMIDGTLSTIAVPDDEQLATYTAQVIDNNGFDQEQGSAPVLKKIKHVIYVVNENRTYDQVLGDLDRGNGDASLTLFGPDVTPNHHDLAERFTTLDNLYAAGEVSTDGWEWSTAANANTLNQKTWPTLYGGRGHFYTAEGGTLAAAPGRRPENSYIWDALSKHSISYRNYGFWATGTAPVEVFNEPNLEAHTDRDFPGYNLEISDQVRFREWKKEFARYEDRGRMPRVEFVKFPQDHTCGTDPACPTPQAMVADSDWATGKLVQAVSHSEFWKSTAIFVIEDDAQDGPDHVDAHRTVGHVISPYTQIGEVDSTFYSSVSMLRTMQLILGLEPLTQFDAAATPMLNSFTNEPDFQPYKAIKPEQPLDEMNEKNAPMARISSKLDFSREDIAPWQTLNEAIWKGVRGGDSEMPARRSTT
ncbi:MAG: bifunctional YncE family protein/alkaline phosphatase family protein [Actinobacteria bacterium]|nr:bifunctional YncE family protein/alkaline phosphatase family protein [Actinomycetota bacterium]